MKTKTSKSVETANSSYLLDKILAGFHKYQEQIAETKTITDSQYRLMAKGICGCKQIVKKILSNKQIK